MTSVRKYQLESPLTCPDGSIYVINAVRIGAYTALDSIFCYGEKSPVAIVVCSKNTFGILALDDDRIDIDTCKSLIEAATATS